MRKQNQKPGKFCPQISQIFTDFKGMRPRRERKRNISRKKRKNIETDVKCVLRFFSHAKTRDASAGGGAPAPASIHKAHAAFMAF